MSHRVMAVAFSGLLMAAAVTGQVNKANLTGTVQDPSGAGIPGAALVLRNTETGIERRTVSETAGTYRFTLLDIGTYRIEAEAPGFKRFVRDGIALRVGETSSVDVTFEIGQTSDAITVTAESPLLRTESGTMGKSVDTKVINELPLIGRNPYVFVTLAPGIQYTADPGALNPWDAAGPSNFSASGSKARSEFLLDGIPNMAITNVSFSPSPDAVEEMRVQTNAFDAEYGHSGSAFVNVSTRAGSNVLHGAAYWYLQNDNLNANSFFNNRSGIRKPESKKNTFGARLSGPAWIPRYYSGRDRTHYFFDYEGTRSPSQSSIRVIVPSMLERTGDFSRTTDTVGRPFTIYDPATTRASGAGYVRDAFPGNLVPGNRQDRVSQNVIKLYPKPTRIPTPGDLANFENIQASTFKWNSMASRLDHQLSTSHRLFFRYGWNKRLDQAAAYWGDCCIALSNPVSGLNDIFNRGNIAAGLGETWVAGPRTVVDFRLGFTRYFDASSSFGTGYDLSSLGFPASFTRTVPFSILPYFQTPNDVSGMGPATGPNGGFVNQYNPLVNAHTALGLHAVKFGFRIQVAQRNSYGYGKSAGLFRFDRTFTRGPDPTRSTANAGHDVADLLLGTPASGYADFNASAAVQNRYWAGYVQDDWKITPRLTLNLGVRLEHEGPATERYDRGNAGFDPNAASPLEARAKANYSANRIPQLTSLTVKGGLAFLGANGHPRGNLSMPALNVSPRLGYAYRLTDRIVWRGGWGVYFLPNNIDNFQQTGFSVATQMINSLDNNLTSYRLLSDPFPDGIQVPPGARDGVLTAVGRSVSGGLAGRSGNPGFKAGISQQFSMGFQFVLPKQISFESAYVGNISQRLSVSRNINAYPNEYLSLKTGLNARVPNPFLGVITDAGSSLSQPTITVAQLLSPFPHFTGITAGALPYGRSHYDSLQLQVSRRMSQGLLFGASYTLSKYLEASSYLNANDAKPEKVISDSDRPQKLVLHGLYELPFGPGRALVRSSHPVVQRIVGGWSVFWVGTYQSGAALAFSGGERVARTKADPLNILEWFDVTQFVPNEPFTLRRLSSRVADLRSAGTRKWDITIQKSIRIRERRSLNVQAEMYNAFNTTHFASPNTNVTSTSFGRITGVALGPRQIQLAARVSF